MSASAEQRNLFWDLVVIPKLNDSLAHAHTSGKIGASKLADAGRSESGVLLRVIFFGFFLGGGGTDRDKQQLQP